MTIYDISLTYTEDLPTWPGDPTIQLKQISSIKKGDLANVTQLSMSVHAGTHIDAPDHFLGNGKTVEDIPMELMVGTAAVVEIPSREIITAADIQAAQIPDDVKRILIKTSNSEYWASGNKKFQEDFIAPDREAAKILVEMGMEVIGVDYLSVGGFHADGTEIHQALLNAGIWIIEGLDLKRAQPGKVQLICLPIKVAGGDGAPARALVRPVE